MNIDNIFKKQENKEELSYKELEYIVNGYVEGTISDEEMTIFLKNICEYDMSDEETIMLTNIMMESGDSIDLSSIDKVKVDKHSTGGVGDKVTLIVAPLVAACGVPVCKMSGKALGFTGGTIDKLDSIEGINTNLELDEYIKQVNDIGIAISSQTANLVPADKKIYALRDVTGTVESIPLIASSIMSKKLVSGADKIVLDIKVGEGALTKDIDSATRLAELMIELGDNNNKKVVAVLTNMENPLGYNIGNSLEVMEAVEVLNNNGEERLTELCIELAIHMVMLGKNISFDNAKEEIIEALNSGEAYNKFLEFIKYQGGDINSLSVPTKHEIYSNEEGYIQDIVANSIGKYVMDMGAGRKHKNDNILYDVGIVLNKKVGDYVENGELLVTVYSDKEIKSIYSLFKIGKEKPVLKPIIFKVIR